MPTTQQPEFDHPVNACGANCGACGSRIIVHCDTCNVRISGCSCTLQALVTALAMERMKRLMGQWTADDAIEVMEQEMCPRGGQHSLVKLSTTINGKVTCTKCGATDA